jgi:hypothetical protein
MGDEPPKPVDPEAEEKYWRSTIQSQPHATEETYEHFAPAYRVGVEAAAKYPGKHFHEIEDDIALDYESIRWATRCPGTMSGAPRRPPGRRSAAWFPRVIPPAAFAAAFDATEVSHPAFH